MLSPEQFRGQLPMFATAEDIVSGAAGFHMGENLEWKTNAVRHSGMAEDVAKHGVQEPVHVMHWPDHPPSVADGNHRVAAAYLHDPKMLVPLMHHDDVDKLNEAAAEADDRSSYWPHHEDGL